MTMLSQMESLYPSVKDALFRRLLYDESVGHLKQGERIIGFDVDLSQNGELPGYTVIAIQKHTLLAYVSERHETPRLILFPTISMLEDSTFGFQNLHVTRQIYRDASFRGSQSKTGRLIDLAQEYLPQSDSDDLSDNFAEELSQALQTASTSDMSEPEELTSSREVGDPQPSDEVQRTIGASNSVGATHQYSSGLFVEDFENDYDDSSELEDDFDQMANGDLDTYDHYDDFDNQPFDSPSPESSNGSNNPVIRLQDDLKQHPQWSMNEISDHLVLQIGLSDAVVRQLSATVVRATPDPNQQARLMGQLAVRLLEKGGATNET